MMTGAELLPENPNVKAQISNEGMLSILYLTGPILYLFAGHKYG